MRLCKLQERSLRIIARVRRKRSKTTARNCKTWGRKRGSEPLNLGQRVRDLRKVVAGPCEQAAQHAGLARSTLSKIENADADHEALKKLAIGLAFRSLIFTPL